MAAASALHVRDWAINQEFFDKVLIVERFKKPNTEAYILLQGFPDHLHEVGNSATSLLSPNDCGEEESCQEFEHFKLVPSLFLQVGSPRTQVVEIFLDSYLLKDFQHRGDVSVIENKL